MWRTWHIKVVYSTGPLHQIAHTVKARNQKEAEEKAFKIVEGKCLGFSVYLLGKEPTEMQGIRQKDRLTENQPSSTVIAFMNET